MGKFTPNGVVVRRLSTGIQIYFMDERSIYVEGVDGLVYIFHRWDVRERGYHTANWRPFRARLMKYKDLDIYKLYRLANLYDISVSVSGRRPQLDGKKLIERE